MAVELFEVETALIQGDGPGQVRHSSYPGLFVKDLLEQLNHDDGQVNVGQGQRVTHEEVAQLEVLLEWRKQALKMLRSLGEHYNIIGSLTSKLKEEVLSYRSNTLSNDINPLVNLRVPVEPRVFALAHMLGDA